MQDAWSRGLCLRGEAHPLSALTSDEVCQIRRLIATSVPQSQIADSFAVARTTIGSIATGRSWKHLLGNSHNG
jgi:hypothetical protein